MTTKPMTPTDQFDIWYNSNGMSEQPYIRSAMQAAWLEAWKRATDECEDSHVDDFKDLER